MRILTFRSMLLTSRASWTSRSVSRVCRHNTAAGLYNSFLQDTARSRQESK